AGRSRLAGQESLPAIYDHGLPTFCPDSLDRNAMNKALTSFALVTVFSGLLMALSLAVARHGYPFGAVGVKRLDAMADAAAFLPLAAVYLFSAMLMMILPIRAAG